MARHEEQQALSPVARLAAVTLLGLLGLACSKSEPERITARPEGPTSNAGAVRPASPSAGGSLLPSNQLRLVRAPQGDVADIVKQEIQRQRELGRRTLVYVGASWCEPCQRFHRAAAAGELDRSLPDLTLVEFDLDVDQQRLNAAGYASAYIPLFALPSADGKASGKQIEGSVKGDGAVGDLVPRLKSLVLP